MRAKNENNRKNAGNSDNQIFYPELPYTQTHNAIGEKPIFAAKWFKKSDLDVRIKVGPKGQ